MVRFTLGALVVLALGLGAFALPGCNADRCGRGLRGNVLSVETTSSVGGATVKQRLEFSAKGELTRTQRAEGRNTTVTEYTRDDTGLLEVTHRQNDALVMQERFDNPLESALMDAAKRVTERCQYTRDSLNRVTRRTCTGDGVIHTQALEYDADGFVSKQRLSAMSGAFGMQTETVFESGAEISWSVAFVAPGNDRRASFTYRYGASDNAGNWLERERLDAGGASVERESRVIAYFDKTR
jgi:hypothetical protein